MELNQIYRPITATPFTNNENYREYEPCDALKPYIRCFWGSSIPYKQKKIYGNTQLLIVPDTCMDIIFGRINERS